MAAPDVKALRRRLQRSFLARCLTSFVAMQGLDRAMVIASQAFTALIPLLILVSAVLPSDDGTAVADAVVRRFGLTGESAQAVQLVFQHSAPTSMGIGSLLLLFYSCVSLTRRMQRMYLQAWGLQGRGGLRGSLSAALGLAALLVEIAMLYLIGGLLRALPFEALLRLPLSALASLLLWTSIPWLLLDRKVPWRRLLPGGILAGTMVSIYGVATSVYMPRLMESYSSRYGLFGVTIALVGWLLCVSVIVVVSTVVAVEFDREPHPWARRARQRLGAPDSTSSSPPAGTPSSREQDA